MPTVPGYTGAPTVEPDAGAKAGYLKDSATPEAFGVGVDQARQGFFRQVGQTADTAADQVNRLQDQYNQAAITDMENQFNKLTAQKTAEYNQLRGKAAVDATPDYQKFLDETRSDVMSGAPNSAVARLAQGHLSRVQNGLLVNSITHSVNQTKQYLLDESGARQKIATDNAGSRDTDDPNQIEAFKNDLAVAELEARKQAQLNNKGPEETELAVKQARSTVKAGRWGTMVQVGKADKAMAEYEADRGNILDPGSQIYNTIYNGQVHQGASKFANLAAAGDYYTNLRGKENSKQDPNAGPGTSSARGFYQFTDATWDSVRKAHPELGLTADGRGNRDQEEKAIRAFTSDNAEKLTDAGVDVNQKNLYVSHFMGQTGGPKFLKALENNPDQSAATLFPAAAGANQNVFYTKEGQARTLQQVYDLQTKNFSAGPMTAATSEAEVRTLEQTARAEAEHRFPGDASAAELYGNSVRNKYNIAKSDAQQTKQDSLNTLLGTLDPAYPPKTLEGVLQDPTAREAYGKLTPKEQISFQRQVLNMHNTAPRNDVQQARWEELQGMMDTDPVGFTKLNLLDEDFNRADLHALGTEQQKRQKAMVADPGMTRAQRLLSAGTFWEDSGISKTGTDPTHQRFMGNLKDLIKNYQLNNAKPPDDDELQRMATSLLAKVPGTGWISDYQRFQDYGKTVPADDTAKQIVLDYKKQWGVEPKPEILRKIYNRRKYREEANAE